MMHVFSNLEEEDGDHLPMCDMTFEIADRQYDAENSRWRLKLRADASPLEPVGFSVEIPMHGWHAQVDGEGDEALHTFWGPVTLCASGHESHRLLALIADYYGVEPETADRNLISRLLPGSQSRSRWTFAERIECFAVGIQSDPASLAEEAIHMKLFFDEGIEEGRYAEVFLNVDLPGGIAALNEKDEEYRSDLVWWLSRSGVVEANPYWSGNS